ncbi:MAG: ATP-binding protein [Verrucomicrobia bacterium]|nr:ATP-binding protein [Verrucomicrobiota bacterium]
MSGTLRSKQSRARWASRLSKGARSPQAFKAQLPSTRPRALELPLDSGKVILLRGIRRSGKTSLFYHTMRRLEASGVAREQILYVNLEDDRLYPIRADELDLILQAHGELLPEFQKKPLYLFLDEIQAVNGWERFVRRVHDTEHAALFVTGSAPHLLGRQIAPVLRGRCLSYELLPLSFSESIRFRDLTFETYSRTSKAMAVNVLEEYLRWGGFPEILLAEEPLRRKIVTEYADVLYYRDLLDEFSVRNEHVMRLLLKHSLSHPAALVSPHKLYHDFRSQGVRISKNTIYEYLRFLEEAGLIYSVPIFAQSLRKQEQNPKKTYIADLGLMQAFTAQPDKDQGRKLENLIFLKKRVLGGELFYCSDGHEVDIVHHAGANLTFTNVCWPVESPQTSRREIAGLTAAFQRFPQAEFELIGHELPKNQAPAPIVQKSAWQYLLE